MAIKPPQYRTSDVEYLDEYQGFSGFFELVVKKLRHRRFAGGWTKAIERELFYKQEAAAAILYDPYKDCIGLVEQFRIGAFESPYGPWCLEVVAGMMEQGETSESLIRRELVEEAGLSKVQLEFITSYYSTPGACNEKIHLFCALCELNQDGGLFGLACENEDIMLHVIPAKKVFDSMYKDRTNNAATLLGLQWLQLNRERLREISQ